jgi:hypothetical protein
MGADSFNDLAVAICPGRHVLLYGWWRHESRDRTKPLRAEKRSELTNAMLREN